MLIVEDLTVIVKCRTTIKALFLYFQGSRGRDRIVIGFTTTYATSPYQH